MEYINVLSFYCQSQCINFFINCFAGTEPFLDNLATSMSDEPGFMLGSIQCVRMNKELRDKIGSILQTVKSKVNICYLRLLVKLLFIDFYFIIGSFICYVNN